MGNMGAPEPPMPPEGDEGGMNPFEDGPDMDEPPMGDEGNEPPIGNEPPTDEPPMGDGMDDPGEQGDDSQNELIDIFKNASLEDKNAILKYAKSQTGQNDDSEEDKSEKELPMESKRFRNKLVNEIINGVISDMNQRDKEKGIKRFEKKISNKKITRQNPFVSGR